MVQVKLKNPPTAYGRLLHETVSQYVQQGRLTKEDFTQLITSWFEGLGDEDA